MPHQELLVENYGWDSDAEGDWTDVYDTVRKPSIDTNELITCSSSSHPPDSYCSQHDLSDMVLMIAYTHLPLSNLRDYFFDVFHELGVETRPFPLSTILSDRSSRQLAVVGTSVQKGRLAMFCPLSLHM